MKFFADHCAYGVTVKFLRGLGYTVETAKEAGLEVADDTDILPHARGTDAVLLTKDLDFANILLYPPASTREDRRHRVHEKGCERPR